MCFSAQASFMSSALLVPAGIYCVQAALDKNRPSSQVAWPSFMDLREPAVHGKGWRGSDSDRGDPRVLRSRGGQGVPCVRPRILAFLGPDVRLLGAAGTRRSFSAGCFAVLGLIGGQSTYLPLLLDPGILDMRTSHHSIYYDMEKSPAFVWMPMIIWEILYSAPSSRCRRCCRGRAACFSSASPSSSRRPSAMSSSGMRRLPSGAFSRRSCRCICVSPSEECP